MEENLTAENVFKKIDRGGAVLVYKAGRRLRMVPASQGRYIPPELVVGVYDQGCRYSWIEDDLNAA